MCTTKKKKSSPIEVEPKQCNRKQFAYKTRWITQSSSAIKLRMNDKERESSSSQKLQRRHFRMWT
uniref:Uncharacterized protein n=1 Tax=Anguilla anguilla TaxID=7936 RepID=A0A0E9UXF1_ANGAN